jgi:hypothetical protein
MMKMNKSKSQNKKVSQPALRLSPYALAKLLFLRDVGDTEIGGFGICRGENLLHVDDIVLVKQVCSAVTVELEDDAVADFVDQQIDAGLSPQQFMRIWVHTHPSASPRPSQTDEATFKRVFGRSDWSLMFILAQEGDCYARLRFSIGPCGSLELPVEVDFSQPFSASDDAAWEQEYLENVTADLPMSRRMDDLLWEPRRGPFDDEVPGAWQDAWYRYTDQEFQEFFNHGELRS